MQQRLRQRPPQRRHLVAPGMQKQGIGAKVRIDDVVVAVWQPRHQRAGVGAEPHRRAAGRGEPREVGTEPRGCPIAALHARQGAGGNRRLLRCAGDAGVGKTDPACRPGGQILDDHCRPAGAGVPTRSVHGRCAVRDFLRDLLVEGGFGFTEPVDVVEDPLDHTRRRGLDEDARGYALARQRQPGAGRGAVKLVGHLDRCDGRWPAEQGGQPVRGDIGRCSRHGTSARAPPVPRGARHLGHCPTGQLPSGRVPALGHIGHRRHRRRLSASRTRATSSSMSAPVVSSTRSGCSGGS